MLIMSAERGDGSLSYAPKNPSPRLVFSTRLRSTCLHERADQADNLEQTGVRGQMYEAIRPELSLKTRHSLRSTIASPNYFSGSVFI